MKTVKWTFLVSILFLFQSNFAQESLHLVATMTGEEGDCLGQIIRVGDVNGDGFCDLLVKAYSHDYALLYWGGDPFDVFSDIRLNGESFHPAGDVNGDGCDDLAIINSIPFNCVVKLYLGSAAFDTIPDITSWGRGFPLGTVLSPLGDINNDGFDDFIIGNSNMGTTCIGCSYSGSHLYLGSDTSITAPCLTFNTDSIGENFGYSICGYDMNRDGNKDVLISAPQNYLEENIARIYGFYSGEEMDAVADSVIYLSNPEMGFISLVNAGDVNHDGLEDLAIINETDSVFVYFSNGVVIPLKGDLIKVGGDINGDGCGDFIIGELDYKNELNVNVGKILGYYGGEDLDALSDFCLEGELEWGKSSSFLSIAGDLNGDGYDEVVVGAPGYPDTKNPLGRVYIYSYKYFVGVDNHQNIDHLKTYELFQNYPNPFNPSTTISYDLPEQTEVSIKIFDITGRLVSELANSTQSAGHYSIVWNGTNSAGERVGSGMYVVRLSSKPFSASEKVLLLK